MRFTPLAFSLAASLMLASAAPAADDDTILFGAVFNLAGPQATFGVPSSNGAMLAMQQINDDGGVLDKDLAAITIASDSNLSIVGQAMQSALIESPSLVAYLGLSDPTQVRAAAEVAKQSGHVFLTSGATSPKLTETYPDILFLACFGDNVQAAAGAEWAYGKLGAKTVHILADMERTYPKLLQGYFAESFTALGGKVTGTDSLTMQSDTVTVKDPGDVDLVFVSVETAAAAVKVIKSLRDAGYKGPVLGGDGYDDPSVWAKAGDLGDIYFTTHVYLGSDNPNPTVTAFVSDYKLTYGDDPSAFSALAYDAVGLMAEAIKNVGAPDSAKIAEGLLAIDGYKGVTGTISYAAGTHIPVKSVTIVKVEQSTLKLVETVTPKNVPNP